MSRSGFITTVTAVLLGLSAAPAFADPGYRPGYYRPGNPGYYPGYFSDAYRGSYPAPGVYSRYAYPVPPAVYYPSPSTGYLTPGTTDAGPTQPPSATEGPASVGVRVPPDAEVWFDGDATHQKGELREYATPTLPPNHEFQYTVRARWTEDGKPVEQTRTITVRANQRTELDFTRPELLKSPSLVPAPK